MRFPVVCLFVLDGGSGCPWAVDPMIRQSLNTEDGLDTAIDQGTNLIAKTRTADVKILSVIRKKNASQVDVQVTNKAGHSFPSGVGFRRAFLHFLVMNGDDVLGAQRATDATGVDTERLVRFVDKLDVAGTSVDNWVLKIGGDEVGVD